MPYDEYIVKCGLWEIPININEMSFILLKTSFPNRVVNILLKDAQISVFSLYQLICTGYFGYKYQGNSVISVETLPEYSHQGAGLV